MGSALSSSVFKPPHPATYGDHHNLIWLTTAGGQLIPAFFVDRSASHTLLFSHGNAQDLGCDGVLQRMMDLAEVLDVNIFAYDYTGYGMSTGKPSEEAIYGDIETAYKYLVDVIGVPAKQIVLYGWSLGSGPSVHLATKAPVLGLVLHGGFSSIFRVALPLDSTLPGDMFANIDKISGVQCPVFIIHGLADNVVPVKHAESMAARCPKHYLHEPYFIEGAGHDDTDSVGGEKFLTRFKAFLQAADAWPDEPLVSARPATSAAALLSKVAAWTYSPKGHAADMQVLPAPAVAA